VIRSLVLALLLLCVPALAHAVPPRILSITASMLEGLPRVEATSRAHDKPAHYSGVSLQSLLHSRFYAASGDRLRGGWLAACVRATGADGYQVVFTLAELDDAFGGLQVLVADQQEGKALPAEDGPLRLVVPSDKRGARSLRQLVRLEILELKE
jgi:DMSO/TMAO reductase YedYZ molybdopterin-dependent catalytic subunit